MMAIFIAGMSNTGYAQGGRGTNNSVSSPYSFYGLGILSNYSFGRAEAMGGTAFGIRNSSQINTANPASYTAIDSMAFLLDFGINSNHVKYKTDAENSASNDANFSHLSISFPIKRWWATALSITPYSNIGYEINMQDSVMDTSGGSNYLQVFAGNGALSKVSWGNAFNPAKNLSAGINAWYLFGEQNTYTVQTRTGVAGAGEAAIEETKFIGGFGVTLGLQYQYEMSPGRKLTVGAVFEPTNKLPSRFSYLERSYLIVRDMYVFNDTIANIVNEKVKTTLPFTYGGGVSYEIKEKLVVGADYYYQKWSDAKLFGKRPAEIVDRTRYSAGMEYIPDNLSLRGYWKRVSYRFGIFYENSYLMLKGKQIRNRGLALGLGLPFKRTATRLNLSAELGMTGTTADGLVEESYAKISLSILFSERWFFKRKIE